MGIQHSPDVMSVEQRFGKGILGREKARNLAILKMRASGETIVAIAANFQLTAERVSQIIARAWPDRARPGGPRIPPKDFMTAAEAGTQQ